MSSDNAASSGKSNNAMPVICANPLIVATKHAASPSQRTEPDTALHPLNLAGVTQQPSSPSLFVPLIYKRDGPQTWSWIEPHARAASGEDGIGYHILTARVVTGDKGQEAPEFSLAVGAPSNAFRQHLEVVLDDCMVFGVRPILPRHRPRLTEGRAPHQDFPVGFEPRSVPARLPESRETSPR